MVMAMMKMLKTAAEIVDSNRVESMLLSSIIHLYMGHRQLRTLKHYPLLFDVVLCFVTAAHLLYLCYHSLMVKEDLPSRARTGSPLGNQESKAKYTSTRMEKNAEELMTEKHNKLTRTDECNDKEDVTMSSSREKKIEEVKSSHNAEEVEYLGRERRSLQHSAVEAGNKELQKSQTGYEGLDELKLHEICNLSYKVIKKLMVKALGVVPQTTSQCDDCEMWKNKLEESERTYEKDREVWKQREEMMELEIKVLKLERRSLRLGVDIGNKELAELKLEYEKDHKVLMQKILKYKEGGANISTKIQAACPHEQFERAKRTTDISEAKSADIREAKSAEIRAHELFERAKRTIEMREAKSAEIRAAYPHEHYDAQKILLDLVDYSCKS